jgi:phosphoglycerate dehydrogenase-like enzyme
MRAKAVVAMEHVAWVEWDDFEGPPGVTVLGPHTAPLDSDAITPVTFYVPPYMTGRKGLAPVTRMPHLRTLQLPNAGYDDALELARPGMDICNARGVHDISTAELALALILASTRSLHTLIRHQDSGVWRPATYKTLWRAKVAVVGFGNIGQTIASLLAPFDADVTGFSRSGTAGSETIDTLTGRLGEFDIVVLILPATPDTVGMVDAAFLAAMKDGALLVNVARGPVVVTDALVAELQSGRLRAAVDVTDPEPLPADHPLWSAGDIIITPHVGGNSEAFEPRMRELVTSQLERLVAGLPPHHIVVAGH